MVGGIVFLLYCNYLMLEPHLSALLMAGLVAVALNPVRKRLLEAVASLDAALMCVAGIRRD